MHQFTYMFLEVMMCINFAIKPQTMSTQPDHGMKNDSDLSCAGQERLEVGSGSRVDPTVLDGIRNSISAYIQRHLTRPLELPITGHRNYCRLHLWHVALET